LAALLASDTFESMASAHCASERIWRDDRSGYLLSAILAVGVASGRGNIWLRPPRHGHCRLAT